MCRRKASREAHYDTKGSPERYGGAEGEGGKERGEFFY